MPVSLRSRLGDERIVLAPGVYDALSALLAEQAGAEAIYLSGASIAYTRLGQPDIGLVSMSEVAETVALIRDRVGLPIIVDADDGFGNALNVERMVRKFERSGASAIQIEDQAAPKRCGHLAGKTLVSPGEMAGKIKAAVDTRRSAETLIIARTDAIAVEGFAPAIERAALYADAGADVLFVEAPESVEQMHSLVEVLGRKPLLANMVEGGKTPIISAADLEAIGFSLAIFPGGAVRALARHLQAYFSSLVAHGTTAPFKAGMFDFAGLNAVIGTDAILERGKSYDRPAGPRSSLPKAAAE
ncbi:MAG: isocitrate lyase/PEP mutase family protein [Beijerinckiaceae bacterium]|nr:isocitrate lyase/PEP mutase family protein [Beijerinckiaceae bacterium]